MEEAKKYNAVGRRKSANARITIKSGKGTITVNKRDIKDYFPVDTMRMVIEQPLKACKLQGKVDIIANVRGSGLSGQAGAIRHGISRALVEFDQTLKLTLRKGGFLTRDPRMRERKKYGQEGARRKFQFSKR